MTSREKSKVLHCFLVLVQLVDIICTACEMKLRRHVVKGRSIHRMAIRCCEVNADDQIQLAASTDVLQETMALLDLEMHHLQDPLHER